MTARTGDVRNSVLSATVAPGGGGPPVTVVRGDSRPRWAALMKMASTVLGQPSQCGERTQRGQIDRLSFVLHLTTAGSPADLNTTAAM
jgi:hypothetical protein